MRTSTPSRFLATVAMALLVLSPASRAEIHNVSKSRTTGNSILGFTGKGYVYTDNGDPKFARLRSLADLRFLKAKVRIADTSIIGKSPGGGTTTIKLLGTTVWSRSFDVSSTGRITSPDMTRSVFGSHKPKLEVSVGPFDVTLKGDAGVGSDVDFIYAIWSGTRIVRLDGYPRTWAYARGRISVSCLVVEVGVELEEKFSKITMDGDLDVLPERITGKALAKYSPSDLLIKLYVELFGFWDAYEKTLVRYTSSTKTYDIW